MARFSRLLAIFIGLLGFTAQQAEKEYLGIMKYVISASVDTPVLDRMLKAIIKRYTGNSETPMCDPTSPTGHCKT
jgi:hypothetical protein